MKTYVKFEDIFLTFDISILKNIYIATLTDLTGSDFFLGST